MAQYDYTALTVGNATAGNAILASDHALAFQNVNDLISPPMCRLELNAAVSIPNNASTVVAFQSAPIDTDSMATTGAGARITINTAGVYVVSASVIFANNANGARVLSVRDNGSGSAQFLGGAANDAIHGALNGLYFVPLAITTLMEFSAADYVDLAVYQSSGGALNIGSGNVISTYLSAVWVGQV